MQGQNLKGLFSQPLSLSRKAAGRIHLLCISSLSAPALFLVAKLSSGDRWYFRVSSQESLTLFHGCYSFPTPWIHLFASNFSGTIVKYAQDNFTVWLQCEWGCAISAEPPWLSPKNTSLWSVIHDSKQVLLLNWSQQLEKHSTDPAGSSPLVQTGSSLCCYVNYQPYLRCPIPTMPDFLLIFP